MSRRFNTYNLHNIVGFSDLFQEYIRIVRFKPDGRLVCVDNVNFGHIWAHPEDIGDLDKCITLPGWEKGYSDDENPFVEVAYSDIAAAGWSKYLMIQRQNFDFNDADIHKAVEDDEWITLTLWGGYIDGRYIIPSDSMWVNRYYLKIRKPVEVKITKIGEENLADIEEDFVTFFRRFTKDSYSFAAVQSYSDGAEHLSFRLKNIAGEKYSVRFSGNIILLEIDKTDPRIQDREEEFEEFCEMTWHHITYKAYSETWDHEHCALCYACIEQGNGAWVNELPETSKTVYICEKCMKDFDDKLIHKEI